MFRGLSRPPGTAGSEKEIAMRTVLIAHRDPAIADSFEADLQREGYHINTCPGPFPPTLRCIQCDTGYCPLTDAADVFIYDPTLVGLGAGGTYQNWPSSRPVPTPASRCS
jgi:hypothetical protein